MFSKPVIFSIFLLSIPLFFLLANEFLPPKHVQISLADELDDLSLFRRATLASLQYSPTTDKPAQKPKIAFLFLANSPLIFSPLWDKFFNGNQNLYNIYIHTDPSSSILNSLAGTVFENRVIAGKRTERSSPTLISATRRLIANAILDDPLNSYFALISQSCIPIHSFHYTYKFLFPSKPKSPFHFFSSENSINSPKSHVEILKNEPSLPSRYIARGKNSLLPEIPFSEFRVGSQFFAMTKRHALVIIKERKLWRKFKLPCFNSDSCYPEEHYFPTLLSMEDPDGCSHHTLTRANWTGSTGGHPYTYRRTEISPELIYGLRKSNNSRWDYLFARKFSSDCLEPLLGLADSVIFND